jgi:hypothetical protein
MAQKGRMSGPVRIKVRFKVRITLWITLLSRTYTSVIPISISSVYLPHMDPKLGMRLTPMKFFLTPNSNTRFICSEVNTRPTQAFTPLQT